MTGTSKDKERTIKFFIIVYFIIFLLIVLKERFIGSGPTFATDKPLAWSEVIDNLSKYLLFSFFAATLFTYVYVQKSIKKK